MVSTLHNPNFIVSVTFILSSAHTFSLDQSKMFLFGKMLIDGFNSYSQRLPTQGSRATGDTLLAPGTGFQAEVGSDLPSGRASDASTVQTYTNTVVSEFGKEKVIKN